MPSWAFATFASGGPGNKATDRSYVHCPKLSANSARTNSQLCGALQVPPLGLVKKHILQQKLGMRLILHTWSSTTPYACRWEHQVSNLRFWSATSCCFESTSYMERNNRAKCKNHKPSLYRSMISIPVSVPGPKPTPAQIAFSIAHVLYWKWYTHRMRSGDETSTILTACREAISLSFVSREESISLFRCSFFNFSLNISSCQNVSFGAYDITQ